MTTMNQAEFQRWQGLLAVMGYQPRTEADRARLQAMAKHLETRGATVVIEQEAGR